MGMRRYLLVALWPAGLAAIAAATVIAARRAPVSPGLAVAREPGDPGAAEPPGAADAAGQDDSRLAEVTDPAAAKPALPARDLIRFGAFTVAGGVLSYGVMRLLGPTIVSRGPEIDEPIFDWTVRHRVQPWAEVMERFNKVGSTWTIWGAACTAAACLGVSWPRNKWLPPSALMSAVLVDKYVTLALRRTFRRPGPPGSPRGTYPSGGCDRAVFFYGLIANMLWREFSGTDRGKIVATGAVAALSFNVAYCREYLGKHWFTDIVTGLFYGLVLLVPFMAAIRLIAGPAAVKGAQDRRAVGTRQLNLAALLSPAAGLSGRQSDPGDSLTLAAD